MIPTLDLNDDIEYNNKLSKNKFIKKYQIYIMQN